MDAPSADIAPGASQATAPGAATRLPHQARAMVLGLTLGVDDGLVGYATLLVLVLVLALGRAVVLGALRNFSRDRKRPRGILRTAGT